ncbi:hypothetical protein ARMGADRAFT_1172284 [Armillaria gallica]|uniref:Uncharacterized protein n=1 Tax=Armillaria gallica TaxID=47427 RepID=A0A2H3CSI5_ARMGA|nr:hypothetical protein ARMGADRAFT_1172284 [Armillaria gallica]
MEHDMPSDIRDKIPHDPVSDDEGMRVTDGLSSFTHPQNPFNQAENSDASAYHANPTGERIDMPSSAEEPTPRRTRTNGRSIFGLRRLAAGRPAGVTTRDPGKYAPSPPFEEAGPTSSV